MFASDRNTIAMGKGVALNQESQRINSLYFCLQRVTDNLIFGSKHERKIAMLSAWFGAFLAWLERTVYKTKLGNNLFEGIIKKKSTV